MNKFIDLLSKVGKRSVEPMGFTPKSKGTDVIPDLLLVATGKKLQGRSGLDKVLGIADIWLEELQSLDRLNLNINPDDKDKYVWGIHADQVVQDQLDRLIGNGCDFIVFDSLSTAASIFTEDKIAAVMKIQWDLEEKMIRTIGELPLDAIFLESFETEIPLTVKTLLNFQSVLGMVDIPILVEISTDTEIGLSDLEILRNIGVTGIVVESKNIKKLAELKSMITLLPRRKIKFGKSDAIAPNSYTDGNDDFLGPGEDDEYDDI